MTDAGAIRPKNMMSAPYTMGKDTNPVDELTYNTV